MPDNIHLGEVGRRRDQLARATSSSTRAPGNPTMTLGTSRAVAHGGSRLFQFDRTGKFVREIGQGAYGLLQAQQVRVDPQDNIWIVDQMSTQVIKFDPNGRDPDDPQPQAGSAARSALRGSSRANGNPRRYSRCPNAGGQRGGGDGRRRRWRSRWRRRRFREQDRR